MAKPRAQKNNTQIFLASLFGRGHLKKPIRAQAAGLLTKLPALACSHVADRQTDDATKRSVNKTNGRSVGLSNGLSPLAFWLASRLAFPLAFPLASPLVVQLAGRQTVTS